MCREVKKKRDTPIPILLLPVVMVMNVPRYSNTTGVGSVSEAVLRAMTLDDIKNVIMWKRGEINFLGQIWEIWWGGCVVKLNFPVGWICGRQASVYGFKLMLVD